MIFVESIKYQRRYFLPLPLGNEVLELMRELSIEVSYTKENIETIANGRTQTFK